MSNKTGRRLLKRVTAFMKRHMRLVSATVLASRYCMGDIMCQYVEVNSEKAKERGLLNARGTTKVGLDLDNLLFSKSAGMAMVAECQSYELSTSAGAADDTHEENNDSQGFIGLTEFLENWDKRRTAMFATFGLLYFGIPGVGHIIYTKVLPRFFPAKPMLAAIVDASIFTPLIYLPMFYLTQNFFSDSFIGSDDFPDAKTLTATETAASALEKWRNNFVEDAKISMAVWIPFHFLNFKFFPVFMRTSVLAVQGIAWVALLSHVRGVADKNITKENVVTEYVEVSSQPPLPINELD